MKHPIPRWLNERRLLPDTQAAGAVERSVQRKVREINEGDRLIDAIARQTDQMEFSSQERKPMGKLAELADRMKATKAHLDAEADRLMPEFAALDKTAGDVFTRVEGVVSGYRNDLSTLKDEVNQLSNAIPLPGSSEG